MKKYWLVLATAQLLGLELSAQQLFNRLEGTVAPSRGVQKIVPAKYTLWAANSIMEASLKAVTGSAAAVIALPTPDGGTQDFKVTNTPVMEAGLAAAYPEIQTYTGVAVGNPLVTAKIDVSPRGLHAMVYNGGNTWFVDPYADVADGYYQAYYKKDYRRAEGELMTCLADGTKIDDVSNNGTTGNKQFGSTLRTYRLALSCTGEYAVAVAGSSPTKAAVLAAMVTSLNRVNGIYEHEVGVTMKLIDNDTSIIYTSSSSDPFTANDDGTTLLTQNQTNTTSVIGSANYDIGHIFSTGGGGIAVLGGVCYTNYKARGVTGSASPVGDAYDVDYVAHEMGHQFGADHTFNANTGSCSGNGESSVAFEPGSGSTIMAYAGICGTANDLQSHSDAYFHAASLIEISTFLAAEGTCSVNTTGTAVPTASSIAAVYNIPVSTPFELTAPVATADSSDTMTYCWEQWNRGNFKQNESLAATFTAGPSLRSFYPTTSPTRVFPKMEYVLAGETAYKGERLSTVARSLYFRLTARNMKDGLGSFYISEDSLRVNVADTTGPFTVTSQNVANDTFYANQQITVSWDAANTASAPVNAAYVNIFLSLDSGYNFDIQLASSVPNSGSYTVTLPDTTAAQARIKVKAVDNVFFNVNVENFRIVREGADLGVGSVSLASGLTIAPNPAAATLNITNNNQSQLLLDLYNAVGQKVWNGQVNKQLQIPVSQYARGMYYLRMTDVSNGQQGTKTVVLQ
ncbi:MAG: zinc-dependent metalloprotease [Edaphocola sp.]